MKVSILDIKKQVHNFNEITFDFSFCNIHGIKFKQYNKNSVSIPSTWFSFPEETKVKRFL